MKKKYLDRLGSWPFFSAWKFHFFTALQDLQSNIRQLMHERDEVQIKANDKDRQLAELRKEVNNVIDKKKRLEHETERLKQHLVRFETNKNYICI